VAALSGTLLSAAFPPHGHALFAWVALAPVFLLIFVRKPAYAFLLSLIFGSTFFLGIFSWILVIEKYTYLHHAILAVYLGAFFAIFGLLVAVIVRFRGVIPAAIAVPFIWVALEYLRSNLSFLALPWGLLAHSQYQVPFIIQTAAIGGTYGVSFLMVVVNAALALLVLARLDRRQPGNSKRPTTISRKAVALYAGTAITLVLVTVIYSLVVISTPLEGKRIKVAVVQGNIEQAQKWDKKFAPLILGTYTDLTMAAAKDKPDLIVWPETATPRAINTDPKLKAEVRRIAASAGTSLLLGSSQMFKFKKGDPKSAKVKNSAYLVPADPGLKISQQYDKIRLFPFGEYLPYKNRIPWDYINVPDVGNYIRGKEIKVFKLQGFQFSVTICWENLFSDFVRQFVKAGAQFIVNMTNEAWFGPTGAPSQFLSMSVFRAVENRVFVIRCANTGISCFIDPRGRIINAVRDANGTEVFIRGVASDWVIPQNSNTVYTRFGDWLVWVSVLISISFLIFSLINKKESGGLS
jgi:apolipoprotein N-acyltransferase